MGMDDDKRSAARRCQECLEALEEERRKILVFQRELPLCLELVTQAIEGCKQQIAREEAPGMSDASAPPPFMEEFIPSKPSSSCSTKEAEGKRTATVTMVGDNKPGWLGLGSSQLWSGDPEPLTGEDLSSKPPVAVNLKEKEGCFQPFKRDKHARMSAPLTPAAPAASSTAETTTRGDSDIDFDGNEVEEGQSQSNRARRKARRCWSPELHRRFLHALQQLGGSHAATPKQIRELMKVDGLTNDEVKSHLQKYRLHTRRPSVESQSRSNSTPLPTQFLLVGGILVQPPEYVAAAAAVAPPAAETSKEPSPTKHRIYAPVASHPSEARLKQQRSKMQEERASVGSCISEGRGRQQDTNDNAADSSSPTSSNLS